MTGVLNRANRGLMVACGQALDPQTGDTVADLGFGGGHGLVYLLDRVGSAGIVHGVDLSDTVINHARKRFRDPIRRGQLVLHHAPMTDLPLPPASLDGAMTVNTVYYLHDDALALALKSVAQALRPGARLAIGAADPGYQARMPFGHGMIARTPAQIEGFLTTAGLGLTDHRRVGESADAFHIYLATR